MEILLYLVPVFLIFSGLEAFAKRNSSKPVRLNDFLSGLSCSIMDQLINAPTLIGFILLYTLISEQIGFFEWPGSWVGWIGAVLLHDLAYYTFHFASHKTNLLWGAHAVHHQGEDYNFTVSWRQGTVATLFTYVFYLPLAFIGVPIGMFLVVHGVYQVFQFFVHTELVWKLGPLEWFVATPSAHRVHHGRNSEYLDKNYGGFLNVWDRVFGTFVPETREAEFGITHGMQSWSPYWANFSHYKTLVETGRRMPGWKAKLKIWFGSPTTLEGMRHSVGFASESPLRYDSRPENAEALYASLQMIATSALSLVALELGKTSFTEWYPLLATFVLLSLISSAAMFDRKPWARHLEFVRLGIGATVANVAVFGGALSWTFATIVLVWIVLSAAGLFWSSR